MSHDAHLDSRSWLLLLLLRSASWPHSGHLTSRRTAATRNETHGIHRVVTTRKTKVEGSDADVNFAMVSDFGGCGSGGLWLEEATNVAHEVGARRASLQLHPELLLETTHEIVEWDLAFSKRVVLSKVVVVLDLDEERLESGIVCVHLKGLVPSRVQVLGNVPRLLLRRVHVCVSNHDDHIRIALSIKVSSEEV